MKSRKMRGRRIRKERRIAKTRKAKRIKAKKTRKRKRRRRMTVRATILPMQRRLPKKERKRSLPRKPATLAAVMRPNRIEGGIAACCSYLTLEELAWLISYFKTSGSGAV